MPFDQWMAACLYDDDLGYYMQPDRQRTGRGGDFFTSVSIGSLFGRALALAFFGIWEQTGRPKEFWLIELGAEDGQLAVDILSSLEAVAGTEFAAAVRYGIMEFELSAKVEVQQTKLAKQGLAEKVTWLEAGEVKEVGVVFGNEVVDAQPVKLLERTDLGWQERLVELDSTGAFVWKNLNSMSFIGGPLADLANFPVGYVTEVRIKDDTLLQAMAARIERGAVLLMDYGFPESELYSLARPAGTLQCYHQHRKSNDPLAFPGEQDISCHVNFSHLVRLGQELGLEPLAWVDQQRSLAGLLTAHAGNPDEPTLLRGLADQARGLRQLQTLMHPEALGAKFHWLWQSKGLTLDPAALPALTFASPRDLQTLD